MRVPGYRGLYREFCDIKKVSVLQTELESWIQKNSQSYAQPVSVTSTVVSLRKPAPARESSGSGQRCSPWIRRSATMPPHVNQVGFSTRPQMNSRPLHGTRPVPPRNTPGSSEERLQNWFNGRMAQQKNSSTEEWLNRRMTISSVSALPAEQKNGSAE